MAYISGLIDAYGNLLIKNANSLLEFGGSTSAYPALYGSGQTLKIRLADNSADGYLTAGVITADGYILLANQSTTPTTVSGFGTLYTKADGNLYYVSSTSTAQITTSSGVGTVTSVGLSLPNIFTVTNSPVTSSGTLTASFNSQTNGYVFAAPAGVGSGTPIFRALASTDIPSLSTSILTSGTLPVTRGGTGLSALVNNAVLAANSSTSISQCAVNSSATNYYLRQVNGTFPSFQQIAFGDLSGTVSLSQISTSGASTSNVITYNGSSVVWGASSTGTVSGVGSQNQVALWNGISSIDGYSNFTWDNIAGNLTVDGYLTLNYNAANTVIIGSGTTNSTGAQAVVIGYNNSDVGGGGENVVIGSTSSAFGTGSGNIAIGNLAATGQSNGSNAIAIGFKAGYAGGSTSAVGQNSVAIGTLTTVTGLTGVAIGYSSSNSGGGGVAIGNVASATNAGISIGANSTASGTNSIAIGNNTSATGGATTAVGNSASTSSYTSSSAFGHGATSTANNQIVFGTVNDSLFTPSGILQFGGITASYPSLRYSGNQLQVRLADNSGDGYLKSATHIVDGYIALQNQTTIPSSNAGFGTLYSNNSDGNLYYVSGTGTTTQITPAGLVSTVYAQSTKTANYTLTTTDYTIFVNASTAVTITLPDATNASNIGRIYNIMRKDDTSNTVTLATTSSQTINGATTYTAFGQYTSITVQSDGSNWYII